MPAIKKKIQILQTLNPLKRAQEFIQNKKDTEIAKIRDLKRGEEFANKWIVVAVKHTHKSSKKYDCKKITVNNPEDEDEMIDCYFTMEYSRIADAVETGDVIILNKVTINPSINKHGPHPFRIETRTKPQNLTEVWIFIPPAIFSLDNEITLLKNLTMSQHTFNVSGILTYCDSVSRVKNNSCRFFLKLMDETLENSVPITLFSDNENEMPTSNSIGDIFVIKRLRCKLFKGKLQCTASTGWGAVWLRFSGDINSSLTPVIYGQRKFRLKRTDIKYVVELRKFWMTRKALLFQPRSLNSSSAYAISDSINQNFPFSLRCKVLAIIDIDDKILLKIWDGTRSQLNLMNSALTNYIGSIREITPFLGLVWNDSYDVHVHKKFYEQIKRIKVEDTVLLRNLNIKHNEGDINEIYISLSNTDAKNIEIADSKVKDNLSDFRRKIKGDNFGTLNRLCYTGFICQLVGKIYSKNTSEGIYRKASCILIAWDGNRNLRFMTLKPKSDEIEEIDTSAFPSEDYLHYILAYDEHAEVARNIKAYSIKSLIGQYIEVINADIRKKSNTSFYAISVHGGGSKYKRGVYNLKDEDPRLSVIKMFQQLATAQTIKKEVTNNIKVEFDDEEEFNSILFTQAIDTEIHHDGDLISLKNLMTNDKKPKICTVQASISNFTSINNLEFLQFYCPYCLFECNLPRSHERCLKFSDSNLQLINNWEIEKMDESDLTSFVCQKCFEICVNAEAHNVGIPFMKLRMKLYLTLQDNQDNLTVKLSGENAVCAIKENLSSKGKVLKYFESKRVINDSILMGKPEDQFADVDEDVLCDAAKEHLNIISKPEEVKEIIDDAYNSEDSDYDEELEYNDWGDETGDFTKKLNASTYRPNSQADQARRNLKYQPHEKALGKYSNKISVEKYSGPLLPSTVTNRVLENSRKNDNERQRKDKSDRATAEQVMDPRTRMILFKLLSRQILTEINGCISTGKEANVYHATGKENEQRAVKVYKTSILTFKDRDKYVTGEFRFRHGYCRHNPRKMVRTWAEKEMRNLLRIHQAGIPCPEPIILRNHVLVMEFLGTSGWPSPKLKDVEINQSKARELYLQIIIIVRNLFQIAKLVHADLSEFNMLYHDNKAYIIDVSQSVEHDHPHALEFLRKDCTNVNDFFKKKNVSTMTVRELFDFVTDPNISNENIDEYIERAMEISESRTVDDVSAQEKVDEEVFKNVFIPQTLEEVVHYERDVKRVKEGFDTEFINYQTIMGLKTDLSGPQATPGLLDDDKNMQDIELSNSDESQNSDTDEEENEEEGNCNDEDTQNKKKLHDRPRDESPNSRKERKKAVKEEKREKRKDKLPKHVKKRKIKVAQQKKKK
ncbi:DgyrCDS3747 [Dimorphilus gyrociliatus]|uniref:Protection of telomeres protein 1 n=1 Tax=Dimorphilus gyrociliatus TaxID=2664684 RepID=A0A7I8VEL7_9ANNE|nr:DgyrCDS3747 [Dimorphilus gyrociliatus]